MNSSPLTSMRALLTADPIGAPVSRSQRAEVGSIPNTEFFESTYKLEWMNQPWNDVDAAADWLLQIENQFRPDLAHLNGSGVGLEKSPVLLPKGVPCAS